MARLRPDHFFSGKTLAGCLNHQRQGGTHQGAASLINPHGSRSGVWDIIEQTGVGMLTTRFGGGMRARPLDVRPDREAGVIYFVIDVRGLKDDDIEACPDICFIVVDARDKAYLSLTGRARILQAPILAAQLWKTTDDV